MRQYWFHYKYTCTRTEVRIGLQGIPHFDKTRPSNPEDRSMFHSQDCRHPRSDTGTCSHSCLRKWTLDTPVGTAITTNCTPPKLIFTFTFSKVLPLLCLCSLLLILSIYQITHKFSHVSRLAVTDTSDMVAYPAVVAFAVIFTIDAEFANLARTRTHLAL